MKLQLFKSKAEEHDSLQNTYSTASKLFSHFCAIYLRLDKVIMSVETQTEPPRTLLLQNGRVVNITLNDPSSLEKIPIIDFSGMYSEDLKDREVVAEKVRKASREIGFFYAINHVRSPRKNEDDVIYANFKKSVDVALANEVLEQAKRFFALPEEKKMEVYTGLVPNEYVGFHPMNKYNRNLSKHKG